MILLSMHAHHVEKNGNRWPMLSNPSHLPMVKRYNFAREKHVLKNMTAYMRRTFRETQPLFFFNDISAKTILYIQDESNDDVFRSAHCAAENIYPQRAMRGTIYHFYEFVFPK